MAFKSGGVYGKFSFSSQFTFSFDSQSLLFPLGRGVSQSTFTLSSYDDSLWVRRLPPSY